MNPILAIPPRRWRDFASVLMALATSLSMATEPTPAPSPPAAASWGSFQKPFAANSLWNSRPVNASLGDFVIPKSDYFPNIGEGPWSTGVFLAKPTDRPMTVNGQGKPGVWDPDAEAEHVVVIPRWPEDLVPASENDGHADIVDPLQGVIHSFWQLKKVDGKWTAALYAWSPLAGSGWGDPAHYYQGARAAGVATTGGLIRNHEIDDGQRLYHHALAVSLTFNALSAAPTYVFPSTSADRDAATTNGGRIPEGALLMLPPSFDVMSIGDPKIRKVAETLKVYGARVVDRNTGTPFNIYVEIGGDFNVHKHGWNNNAANDLEALRLALREVKSVDGWLDGNGKPFTPEKNLNLLSMRGPWRVESGDVAGTFDTWQQAVTFARTTKETRQANDTGRGLNAVTWAIPESGKPYRLTAIATGGGKLRLIARDKSGGRILVDSGELSNGESKTFVWPEKCAVTIQATSGVGSASTVRGTLFALPRTRS